MTDTLTIDPNGPNETVYTGDDFLIRDDAAKTHTGLGDFRAIVPRDRSLKDRKFDEVWIESGGDFLFRGFIHSVRLRYNAHETELGGRGIGYELTNDEVTNKQITEQFAHTALGDYIDDETDFTAVVTEPTASSSVSGNSAQEANTDAEFSAITSIGATDPLEVRNNSIEVLQTCFFQEAETASGGGGSVSNGDYSGGSGESASSTSHDISFQFTTEYTIPAADVGLAVRLDTLDGTHMAFSLTVDGETTDSTIEDVVGAGVDWFGETNTGISGDLSPGTYTAKIDFTGGTGAVEVDCLAVYDGRFNYTFDNTVDVTSGFLDGPQLYPDQHELTFDSENTGWNITSGTLTTAFNSGTDLGPQRQQLRLGSGTWFPNDGTEDQTSDITTTFGSEAGSSIQGRFRFSRYGSRDSASPRKGYLGTDLNSWEITYDGNDIGFFDSLTLDGDHFSNIRLMARQANLRFVIPHRKNEKEIHVFRVGDETRSFPEVTVKDEEEISDVYDYFNHCTVRGAKPGSSRLAVTFESASDIATYGKEHEDFGPIPELDTQAEVDSYARSKLGEGLQEIEDTAILRVVAATIDPGFSYTVPLDGGATTTTAPLEEIRYVSGPNELEAVLEFDQRSIGLAEALSTIQSNVGEVRRGF